jgi:hypothetical protein
MVNIVVQNLAWNVCTVNFLFIFFYFFFSGAESGVECLYCRSLRRRCCGRVRPDPGAAPRQPRATLRRQRPGFIIFLFSIISISSPRLFKLEQRFGVSAQVLSFFFNYFFSPNYFYFSPSVFLT